MKTISKVLESMLSKPATRTWDIQTPALKPQVGPTQEDRLVARLLVQDSPATSCLATCA